MAIPRWKKFKTAKKAYEAYNAERVAAGLRAETPSFSFDKHGNPILKRGRKK